MHIASILPPEAVIAHFAPADKKQALKQLAAHAAKLTAISERAIYSALQEREHLGCTGMGNGVCIPHGRMDDLGALQAVFARLDRPIDFGAADGRPVDLVFLLLTPTDANIEHIKAIAVISRLLRDKLMCEALRKARDEATLHALLTSERGENAA